MEATVPTSYPPLPTPAQLADARKVAGNPGLFTHFPDFWTLTNTAWWALKADQLARINARKEADRTAAAIRSAFPDDAA